ncbi:MAG: hypothetical protein UIH41_00590, partial [Treponemataceae bacterium]|nr:hypothetical protein [Treponemataceae bacterium]
EGHMKKFLNLITSLLVVLLCCFLFSCASNQNVEEQNSEEIIVEPIKEDLATKTNEEFYNQFLVLFNNGDIKDYDALEKHIENWENSYPNDPDLYTAKFNHSFAKAVISETQEETFSHIDEAITTLLNALELYPNRLDIWFGLISFSQRIGDYNLTIDTMRRCIDQSKVNNHQWLWELNKPAYKDEAPLEFRITNFLWDFHAYISYWLDEYTYESHDCVKYIIPFLLEMDPNHVAILNDMAYCHLNLDEIEEAKVYLLKAHEIDPEDYVVIGNLAYVSMKQGDYATAWEYAAILQKSEDPEYVEIGNEMMKEILELGMDEEIDSFQYVDDLF